MISGDGTFQSLTFSPDGRFLIGGGRFRTAVVWDAGLAGPDLRHSRLRNREASWHAREVVAFETTRDWFPAVFHLERLVALEPANAEYRTRLDKAKAALAAQAKK